MGNDFSGFDWKDGEKIVICHAKCTKKKHIPVVFLQFVRRVVVFLQFVRRVGVWSRVLVSDGAGEIMETKLKRQLLARSCKHQVAARGAHHENGPAERAIQEIHTGFNNLIGALGYQCGSGVSWAEHTALVDAMTTNSTSDKSKTIFEAVHGFVPDVDTLPPIGCSARKLIISLTRSWG